MGLGRAAESPLHRVAARPDGSSYARLAELARMLAAANDVESVLSVIRAEAASVTGADVADIELADGTRLAGLEALADTATVPLTDGDGRAIGAIRLGWRSPAGRGREHRPITQIMSQLCARTLVRLRSASRATDLARMAASLAAASTGVEVARLLSERGRTLLGASHSAVRVLDAGAGALTSLVPLALPAPLAKKYREVRLDSDLPVAVAVRTNNAIWLDQPSPDGGPYATAIRDAAATGVPAFVALPLRAANGSAIGAVSFGWSARVRLDDDLRTSALTMAEIAGRALERALNYDTEHATLVALQHHLLGPPATVPGVDIAVRYLPGESAAGMGGDWYDTVVRDDGTLVVIVGDVAGHGVEAVAAMAQVQYLIAGLVRNGTPLHQVFAATNEMIDRDEPVYATAQLFHLDPGRHRVGYHNAGHPWALLRDPGGRVGRLDGAQHPPIGVPCELAPLIYTDFGPGSILLAYTDGLVERPGRSIVERVDRLAEILAGVELRGGVNDILRRVVAAARRPDEDGEPLNDDVAAVLIRG